MSDYDFQRYLESKVSIDDRALNRQVYAALLAHLPPDPLNILELGAGIGTMFQRLQRWGLLTAGHYTAIDAEADNIRQAQTLLTGLPSNLTLSLHTADIYEFAAQTANQTWQLVIAHAVLDLLHLPQALPLLKGLLAPGGLAWLTLNFDGVTSFEPPLDPALDAQIVDLYHHTMDTRLISGQPAGHSQTGRQLLTALPNAGFTILAAGSSDWVVLPHKGRYPHDEAYFLGHILHFVETSLMGHPNLPPHQFANWLAQRRKQLAQGELVYLAHQIDVLVQRSPQNE